MNMAFVDMNPFPLRQIQNRRTFHLEKVRLELTELESIRQTFLRDRETSQEGRTLISDDEEDNWIPASQQWHVDLCENVTYLVFFFFFSCTQRIVNRVNREAVFGANIYS